MSSFSALNVNEEYGDQETAIRLSSDLSAYIISHYRSKDVTWRSISNHLPLRRLSVLSPPNSCCFWDVKSRSSEGDTYVAILRSKAGELELYSATGDHVEVKVSKHICELLPCPSGLLLKTTPLVARDSNIAIMLYSMDGPYSAVRAVDTSALINPLLPSACLVHVHNHLAVFRYGQSGQFALCRIEKKIIMESTVAHQFNASADMNISSLLEKSVISGEHSSRPLEQFISINSGNGSLSRSGSTSRIVNVARGGRSSISPSAMRTTSPLVQAELASASVAGGTGYNSDTLQSFLGVKPTMHFRDIEGISTSLAVDNTRNASLLLHRANSPKIAIDTNNLILFNDQDEESQAAFDSEYFTINDPHLVVMLLCKFEVAESESRDVQLFFAGDKDDDLCLNITDSTTFLNQYTVVITDGDEVEKSCEVSLTSKMELRSSASPVQFASVLYEDSCRSRSMSVLLTLINDQLMVGVPGSATFIPLATSMAQEGSTSSDKDVDWIHSLLSGDSSSKIKKEMKISHLHHISSLSEYFAVVNETTGTISLQKLILPQSAKAEDADVAVDLLWTLRSLVMSSTHLAFVSQIMLHRLSLIQVLCIFHFLVIDGGKVKRSLQSLLIFLGVTTTNDNITFTSSTTSLVNEFSEEKELEKVIITAVEVLSRRLLIQSSMESLRRYLVLEKAIRASFENIKVTLQGRGENHLTLVQPNQLFLSSILESSSSFAADANEATNALLHQFTRRCQQQSPYGRASLTFLDCAVDLYTATLASSPSFTWEAYITSLATPLQQILELVTEQCMSNADSSWPAVVLHWLGRVDLAANKSAKYRPLPSSTSQLLQQQYSTSDTATDDANTAQDDGLNLVEIEANLRFPDDNRMHEVCRLLTSCKNPLLKIDRRNDTTTEVDNRAVLLERLALLLRRTFTLSIGRGMVTIATTEPLMAEKLPIPLVTLTGRVPPHNTRITSEVAVEVLPWVEFHNGVAAALRVGPRMMTSPTSKVTRNWILFNKTATATSTTATGGNEQRRNDNTHAGFLFGLGLFGHLNVISITDVCDYLTQGHEPTTVAMLLGIAISKMGSMDKLASKTLFLHLPALLPTPHWEIEISPVVQCAALTGIGFLYCRSGNRLMVQFLLEELMRKPTSDRSEAREALAMSAAWALAMVMLPLSAAENDDFDNDGYNLNNVNDSQEQQSSERNNEFITALDDMKVDEKLFRLISGGLRPSVDDMSSFAAMNISDPSAKTSRILEGNDINIDITAPAATVALGLLYMKTNNAEVLRRLAMPVTVTELNSIRPDQLLYRALARTLILWDQVEPSKAWLTSQQPAILRRNAEKGRVKYSGPYGQRKASATAGVSSSLDTKISRILSVNMLTGHCLGIGLIYAGTFAEGAKGMLLEELLTLKKMRDAKDKENIVGDKVLKVAIETAICSVSLALSCVMAGSGDLDCLRIFRELRSKVDGDQVTGSHMAVGMAIGMLFLGGGKWSLKRDPMSIACLLMSILPRYPIKATDNQYHLQALRHLYVIAIEPRVLHTIDVDTGESLSVDLELTMTDGSVTTAQAPGLLPELKLIKKVAVKQKQSGCMKRFYPCTLDLQALLLEEEERSNSSRWRSYELLTRRSAMLPPLFVKVKPSACEAVKEKKEVKAASQALLSAFFPDNEEAQELDEVEQLKQKLSAEMTKQLISMPSFQSIMTEAMQG